MRVRIICAIIGVVVGGAAGVTHACMWDRDTLAAEAAGLPGVIEVIVGRFERNPPLFYEMRLERVAGELEREPGRLELYDDAAVAADRLGRHDEAIAWMEKKREAMYGMAEGAEGLADHEYRYLANLGTFHMHRWIAAGADRSEMRDAERARELIAAAIELNPDAHFGREVYQLLFIEWVLDPEQWDEDFRTSSLFLIAAFREKEEYWRQYRPYARFPRPSREDLRQGIDEGVLDAERVIKGLSGLVALGNAWESMDVYEALSVALTSRGDSTLAFLANLRIRELTAAGRRTMRPGVPRDGDQSDLSDADPTDDAWALVKMDAEIVADYYEAARAAAREWHERRMAFMTAKLEQGLHPDTDAGFWDGYVDGPALPSPPGIVRQTVYGAIHGDGRSWGIICAIAFFAIMLAWFYRRRYKFWWKRATD